MIGETINPALTLMIGAILVPFLPGKFRNGYLILLPLFALIQLCSLPFGTQGEIECFGMTLTTIRLDKLSFIFALIFLIAAIVNAVYALHVKDNLQHVMALIYEGAAIGAVLAGDLVTLFVYWEVTAFASVFLIWARRTEKAYKVGIRYLIVQVGSGVLLLAGAAMIYRETGSIEFKSFDISLLGAKFMLVAFGIKCAFPLLHSWLQDAYPEATITGTVVLSAFTTKLAVYALARGFAGTEILIVIGAVMTVFPIFFAIIENDLRRVLAFSLNDQLGFMVVGIGIGTELAINGAAAHAFCHILYKALLFMSMGAVFYRTGTVKASELGGLARSMPWTAGFCCVGAAAISALPLFCGFISKTMIITAAAEQHLTWVWIMLLISSAGAIHYCGFKLPYFAFFSKERTHTCEEAPSNMLAAMGIMAFLCIFIGLFPGVLYGLLPYEVHYHPFELGHVVTKLQLLVFSALLFVIAIRKNWYPNLRSSINLDLDWLMRKPGLKLGRLLLQDIELVSRTFLQAGRGACRAMLLFFDVERKDGILSYSRPTGVMAIWVIVLLAISLLFYYI